MKKTVLLILITINVLSTSCSKSNDGMNFNQGNWSGNLIGDPNAINGTWTGTISSSGNFTGKVITTQSSPDHDFVLSGKVDENGNLIATMKNAKYNITIDYIGKFSNNLCNGTWVFNGAGMDGTWNGTKN